MTYEEYLHFLLDADKFVIKNYNLVREIAYKSNAQLKLLQNIQGYVTADNWDNFEKDIVDKIMNITDTQNKLHSAFNSISIIKNNGSE